MRRGVNRTRRQRGGTIRNKVRRQRGGVTRNRVRRQRGGGGRRQRGKSGRTSRRPHTHRHLHPHRGHGTDGGISQVPGTLPDTGGCNPNTSCEGDNIWDCNCNCVPSYYVYYYLGDGFCDDPPAGFGPNFNCAEFNFDGGDCTGNGMQKGGRARKQHGGRSGQPKPWGDK